MVAAGEAVIVILLVAVIILQPPAATIVLVTVYVPAVLADKFTCPVEVSTKTKPDVDENIPALPPPMNVGKGFDSVEQYGVDA